ncbi:hypothetical protein AGMMS49921_08040 [Endomicrobiia bacterium]|nr:hypothetical protein AGMMS49921_08040 [Endomicrobiia bacterium]
MADTILFGGNLAKIDSGCAATGDDEDDKLDKLDEDELVNRCGVPPRRNNGGSSNGDVSCWKSIIGKK